MIIDLTQDAISSVLDVLPAGHPQRVRLEALVRESSTLRVLHEIGLADGQDAKTVELFATWPTRDDKVHASLSDAKAATPRTFRSVCTEWGRAGYIHRKYPLRDGRTVVAEGVWWSVPEPGGKDVAFYFY